jgi:cellulose synthase (UDP-forming)
LQFIIILSIILISGVVYVLNINFKQKFGLYDPKGIFASEKLDYDLSYFSWDADPMKIKAYIQDRQDKDRLPIVTLEPWPTGSKTDQNVLQETTSGKYDNIITNICKQISDTREKIIVRWGHEMEIKNHRYPWSGQDVISYKDAYKYFVDRCRDTDPNKNIYFMWSPSGESGLEQYYPGSRYVDMIGLSVYSFDQWDEKNLGAKRSFVEVFNPKYFRVIKFWEPIIIVELGVTGTEEYKTSWIRNALFLSIFYPRLVGAIYFNSEDVASSWGLDLPTPDWRIRSLPR